MTRLSVPMPRSPFTGAPPTARPPDGLGAATEQRQVTLGRNDDNYIEIVDGLEEGDAVVALSPQGSSIMSAMGME